MKGHFCASLVSKNMLNLWWYENAGSNEWYENAGSNEFFPFYTQDSVFSKRVGNAGLFSTQEEEIYITYYTYYLDHLI